MRLKSLEINGFKSFAKKVVLEFNTPISGIVGPNGSGKSNVAEAFRFVLGEQSIKSMRGKRGEDLIFGGNNFASKLNRASVKAVFDNKDKSLPIDFDEVKIERVVHRDGVNEYFINGSPVRLKDISEFLSSANIGSSGHHIISQGEADKILNSSVKERKEMLEDALGLRIFQYKKIESEKKLEKTRNNIEQVQSLRREIAPHIKYLKKQVEKIEEGRKIKAELEIVYKEFLKRESEYLKKEKKEIESSINEPKIRLQKIETEIQELEKETQKEVNNELITEIKNSENVLYQINHKKSSLIRQLGQLEGQIVSLKKLKEKDSSENQDEIISFSKKEIITLKDKTEELHKNINNLEIFKQNAIALIEYIRQSFYKLDSEQQNEFSPFEKEIQQVQRDLDVAEKMLKEIEEEEQKLKLKLKDQKTELESDKTNSLQSEKKIIELLAEKNIIQQKISEFAIREDALKRDSLEFQDELRESVALVGRQVLDYETLEINLDISRQDQIDNKRKLERMKIKVEETVGYISEETEKEYAEVTERDGFLLKEIEDLEKSALSLEKLIKDLEIEIENKFKFGLQKINKEFQNFFSLMFGGGNASLNTIKIKARKKKISDLLNEEGIEFEEDQEEEEGIDISVNLPRKRIKDLMMLSGGERALTSIALLFAISQVNPPPFIILDETDAALDEANSKKYADMIESLSEYSQLILITHNRETMSRAGLLYGVTMTQGISQLLSIAFEEGVEYAK